jgi:uncharacterized protein (TIGR02266 family)
MGKKIILLADDTHFFLELEKTFFRREEFDIQTAHTGREALRIVNTACPDIAFLDMHMPEMNGDECCRWIKANPKTRHLPVIMVTLSGREEDLERCRQAGCDDLILKPINRDHFIETARKFLKVPIRQHPRFMARFKINLAGDNDNLLSGYSLNLSAGGVFLETMTLMEENTRLDAEFLLPNSDTTIKCKAQVAWVNHPEQIKNPNLPVGMGIRFIDLSQESLDEIRTYIADEKLSPMW